MWFGVLGIGWWWFDLVLGDYCLDFGWFIVERKIVVVNEVVYCFSFSVIEYDEFCCGFCLVFVGIGRDDVDWLNFFERFMGGEGF